MNKKKQIARDAFERLYSKLYAIAEKYKNSESILEHIAMANEIHSLTEILEEVYEKGYEKGRAKGKQEGKKEFWNEKNN